MITYAEAALIASYDETQLTKVWEDAGAFMPDGLNCTDVAGLSAFIRTMPVVVELASELVGFAAAPHRDGERFVCVSLMTAGQYKNQACILEEWGDDEFQHMQREAT